MDNKTKIIGNIVGVPNPKSDWAQNDETKADYIKNKPPLDVYANAIKGKASGAVVNLNDVSPIEHELKVKLSSKNLFNNDTSLLKEITYKTNDSGGQGTRIGYEPLMLPIGTYTFTLKDLNPSMDKYIYGYVVNSNNRILRDCKLLAGADNHTPRTITIAEGERVFVYNGHATLDINARAKEFAAVEIQLEKGEKATEYTPFVPSVENVKVSKFGKNLISYPFRGLEVSNNELSVTDLGDGGVLISGTVTKDTFIFLTNRKAVVPCYLEGSKAAASIGGKEYTFVSNNYDSNIVTVNNVNSGVYILVKKGTTCNNIKFYPQIEVGDTATEFEKGLPYETLIPNADGTVEGGKSVYPQTTFMTNTEGVLIDCQYSKDINKAFAELQQAIISLGGNV